MFSSSDTILSSSFRYADQRFLWSRMQLYEDRIEFRGLSWTGLHRRTLPLERIKDQRWWTGGGNVNYALLLDDDERIYVHVKSAGLWKHEVEARAANLDPQEATLPQQAPAASHARAA